MKNLYLAGPMTGLPQLNFPAFREAARRLRRDGYAVVSPAENAGGDTSQPKTVYMRMDLRAILDADAVVFLPGADGISAPWLDSDGACSEAVAARAIGCPAYLYQPFGDGYQLDHVDLAKLCPLLIPTGTNCTLRYHGKARPLIYWFDTAKSPQTTPELHGRLPASAAARKHVPIATGVLDYFPDAIAAVAHVSFVGNEQHNPGKPMRWDRSKSGDEADALVRHLLERGTLDKDGLRHTAKTAWRALALLQKEIECEHEEGPDRA